MKYIYDESGKKIAEYFESSSIEDIQKDYLEKFFIEKEGR